MAAAALLLVAGGSAASAQKFHCEKDTAESMTIVRELLNPGGKPGEICGEIAIKMVGRPYSPITEQDVLGEAQIRLDGFDAMTFINMVSALAKGAAHPGYLRPVDLQEILESLTFRRGVPAGFPSRMVYGADWALDNRARGNVKELTEDYSDRFKTKSLDWVSRHRDNFAALKDSATYEKQKIVEMGYRTFKIPHIKREAVGYSDIEEDMKHGDVVMLLSPDSQMDIYQIGFVVKRPDGFHFVHASRDAGKVVEEPETLSRYVKRNAKYIYGWRWLRIQ